MLLSIIIVNYNVRYFLEQCLFAIKKTAQELSTFHNDEPNHLVEVIVVDNASSDGSFEYLADKFEFVHFILNETNPGFSKANNQALKIASGEFVLFINPDTIVPEDFLRITIGFMEMHAEAGALGVRMIDGSGNYLKESKRKFPSPWVSFCKLSGLTAIFPTSRRFGSYYLGDLDEKEIHEVDALAGACILARKKVIDGIGGFDERFFMYGEDLDLSYRIIAAGYKNYYFPGTEIIHFKGESTKRDALYIKYFYKAMILFMEKYYGNGSLFTWLMKRGIQLRASCSRLGAKFRKETKPIAVNRLLLKGERETVQSLKEHLPASFLIIETNENPDAIVYCEGISYNFKQIIVEIESLPATKKAMIHAAGSDSVVGSFERTGQGISIAIISV